MPWAETELPRTEIQRAEAVYLEQDWAVCTVTVLIKEEEKKLLLLCVQHHSKTQWVKAAAPLLQTELKLKKGKALKWRRRRGKKKKKGTGFF